MVQAKVDIYEIVTERMIQRILTEGTLPWKKPWKNYSCANGQTRNLISKKPYRGINVWILAGSNYSSQYWLTYKQAQQLKGTVRKGEKGTPVVYWAFFDKKETDSASGKTTTNKIPMLRYYTVFNVDQCDDIKAPETEIKEELTELGAIEAAERIIENMPKKPTITFAEDHAYYSPSQDKVNIPKKESFTSLPEFYSTFFHELVHATGHESRCARKRSTNDWNRFGSDPYAKEELIAEMGASFLCGVSGIQPEVEDNSVAYIQTWIKQLKNDKKLLVQAAGAAQKAADFILGINQNEEEE